MSDDLNIKPTDWQSPEMVRHTQMRNRRERRFKLFGLSAVVLAASFLFLLLGKITLDAAPGFLQTSIEVDITFDKAIIGDPRQMDRDAFIENVRRTNMFRLVQASMDTYFPEVTDRRDRRRLLRLFSAGARDQLRNMLLADPMVAGTSKRVSLLASDDIDQVIKGHIDISLPELQRKVKNKELSWLQKLEEDNRVSLHFHSLFFTSGDSRDPELAGIWGAAVGSALTLFVTLIIAFPIGVLSAIYLEEFAPKNRFTDFIEININNLAAVPSIVFGLLGLAVFLGTMGLPRSAPLVGGMTLALMTLPTIIIASRASIKAVPPSIRDAAMGLGASPMQVVFHHVLPLAFPGILTGTIIGMAQALGETAPLLMIGMVAFIVDIPASLTDAATALPVQIYLWADSPERAFVEKTSAAILVLLTFLIVMNALAIWLRQKFERDW
ncbi:phosphate ABC transporter permease PstA [Kordiimonas sp. SCSIO 12603]|uniref:phosphate ABC transporter permease PstA n=1 Tax=Kordiimonas sp. SCSIO 12603 TaxID=2829596 RepID=UPI0021071509|nr:phosphate ABC transporter permease PstA [Kordiimonas sp. SCSIO 12603]UTW57574.1 phosphate ABC transporter permease PstA [Kordiimonas sp. SCSIO 12603]